MSKDGFLSLMFVAKTMTEQTSVTLSVKAANIGNCSLVIFG